jgi:hypothetical protein
MPSLVRKPKITARQEGGDDGYQYVIRVDGRVFVTGLHRSEVQYYKTRALREWEQARNVKERFNASSDQA